jgi:hypothetical protein
MFVGGGQKRSKVAPTNPMRSSSIGTRTFIVAGSRLLMRFLAALEAGVPLRDVQLAARHADPRTTTINDRRRQNFDRHAAYVVVALVTSG